MTTPEQYRIRVIGHLSEGWSELLEDMEIACEEGGNTTLTGPVKDQAALYGLIARLQALGLTLISVNEVGMN
jgi:hypothetical protein